MSPLWSELCKAIFVVAMFACVCGLLRALFVRQLEPRLKLALCAFLLLMLIPTTYLYLRLAFPAGAEKLVPVQSLAIWMYGPVLLGILHLAMHRPLRAWQAGVYIAPVATAVVLQVATQARLASPPPWWGILSLAQAVLFATAALVWTIRRRGQLRILVTAFSASAFGALLYLCAGILALLLFDFVVHWRMYSGRPPSPAVFYLWVTPCAIYTLGISLWLIWRAGSGVEAPLKGEVETAAAEPKPESASASPRKLELSPSAAQELALLLESQMREQRLFTRNDLSLAHLASALRISTHLTSELLNAHLRTTFYEYVNRHRAAEAAELLRSGKGKFSIADIAYEAGFNNVNTFYREFKRVHGVTPANFRRSVGEPGAARPENADLATPH